MGKSQQKPQNNKVTAHNLFIRMLKINCYLYMYIHYYVVRVCIIDNQYLV